MDFYDEIYYTLIGELEPGRSGVRNAFASGSECDLAYTRLLDARNRVLEKLGTGNDPDLERMLGEMEVIQRLLCRKILEMFCPR